MSKPEDYEAMIVGTPKKKTVLHAWRLAASYPIPRTHGAEIEVRTAYFDREGLPAVVLTYDSKWGNGRGGWFNANGTAFATNTIFQWRPYVVIQPKKEG